MDRAYLQSIEEFGAENGWVAPLTQEDKAFLQWKHLSSSENIRRFRVCIQNHSFDEATQRLWDEWLSLYGRMPACLREFIADAEINGYIHEKAEQSMQE